MFKFKHFYTMGILMAGTLSSHAQIILTNPVTEQNKSVTDPYSIRLLPGFNAASPAVNSFRASLGASSNPNPTPNNYAPNPTASISVNENYIYSRTYLAPRSSSDPAAPQQQSISYFDGLGRPKQELSIKSTPNGKDLVSDIPYDNFGRQVQSWLPVPMNSLNGNIQAGVQAAARNQYKKADGSVDPLAYGEKTLENSPLDRVLAQAAPGSDWDGKKVTYGYEANADNEVRKFVTTTNWITSSGISTMSSSLKVSSENTTSVSGGYYKGSTLYKNTVKDEDGNTTTEFKNGQGQTLLVRKTDGTLNLDTYYIYNEYDQLAFVIPPLAVEAIKALTPGTVIPTATLNSLCYQYQYDSQKRLIAKRLPGKGTLGAEDGWEYMVYDKQDRLVLTQDPKMKPSNQWLFTKYDKLGRIIYTGLSVITGDRASIQSVVDTKGVNNEARTTTPITLSGLPLYYTNSTAYPTSFNKLLSVNYYDTYPVGSPAVTNAFAQPILKDTPESITANGLTSVRSTSGLPTASFVNNIENDAWTKNYTWYDTKARVIGSRSNNHLGGYTIVNNKLDFSGAVLSTNTYHKRLATDTEKQMKEVFSYDHQNRLVKHIHQVDSNPVETLTENIYNELGQLEYQNIGNGMQSIKSEYNIRGALAKVNDPKNLMNKLFGYELKYINPQSTTKKYNGNIAEIDWATQNDGTLRRYSYQYDGVNRLKEGNYWANSGLTAGSYAEKLTYDLNGNIKSLQRAGQTAANIDNLSYTYDNSGNSNKLIRVNDASGNAAGYPVGGNTIAYDINGNMVNHLDKGISNIAYNYLNLPNSITASIGNTDYVYRADGSKVKKVFGGKTTDYLDGFQYEDNVLQFIPTAEGYYDVTKNKYIYNYTDHLGNVRLSYTKGASGGAEIIEENNYYPFGLKHQGYNSTSLANNAYQYKYNGKELQETGMYDYGARMYMPELGRWGVVDLKSEFGRRWSPYTYAFDNPIRFIDPDGMWPWPTWKQIKTLASTYYSGMYQGAKGSLKGTYHGVKQLVTNPIGTVKSAAKAIINDPKGVMKSMQGRYTDPFTLMALGIGSVATGDASAAGKYVGNTYTNMATDAAVMVATEGVGNIARGLVSKVGKASTVAETESALSGGTIRAAKFSEGWENASLSNAINKFAPDAEGVANASGKTIYNNSETGIQVVYDNNGNYFRVENTNLSGKRNYLDMNGNVPNNKTVNGKQAGRNNAEYNQVTHFNNID